MCIAMYAYWVSVIRWLPGSGNYLVVGFIVKGVGPVLWFRK